jgi:hypothetical protein
VLVRFVEADKLLRVDTVLWLEKKFHEAIQTYPPSAPDADSGWQQAETSGHTIFFRGPDVEHRVGYTAAFRVVNKDGSDFILPRTSRGGSNPQPSKSKVSKGTSATSLTPKAG